MNFSRHRVLSFYLAAILYAGFCATYSVAAQTNLVTTNAASIPPMPALKSPLSFFRELLAMSATEREQRLADRSPEKRRMLLVKIHEYESMSPTAREETLTATELHWYLKQLVQSASTNRAAQLAQIPEPCRQMVAERLSQWDILPPPLQQEVLAHESTRNYFLLGTRMQTSIPSDIIPPTMRQELVRLDTLLPQQRLQSYANFQHFFALTATEKQTILKSLPAAERQQVEITLAGLNQLPNDQRKLGLQSLSQLAGLSAEQRREFFNNAYRWKQLSPAERETWLKLVTHLPPMPPNRAAAPPMPGMSVATNPNQ